MGRQGHYMANVPAMSAICCTLDFPHCSLDLPGFRMPCRAVLSVNLQKSAGSFCSLVLRKSCTANFTNSFCMHTVGGVFLACETFSRSKSWAKVLPRNPGNHLAYPIVPSGLSSLSVGFLP